MNVTFNLSQGAYLNSQQSNCRSVADSTILTVTDEDGTRALQPIVGDLIRSPVIFEGIDVANGQVTFAIEVMNDSTHTLLFDGSDTVNISANTAVDISVKPRKPVMDLCLSYGSDSLYFDVANYGLGDLSWWLEFPMYAPCYDSLGSTVDCVLFSVAEHRITRVDTFSVPPEPNTATRVDVHVNAPPDSVYSFDIVSDEGAIPFVVEVDRTKHNQAVRARLLRAAP